MLGKSNPTELVNRIAGECKRFESLHSGSMHRASDEALQLAGAVLALNEPERVSALLHCFHRLGSDLRRVHDEYIKHYGDHPDSPVVFATANMHHSSEPGHSALISLVQILLRQNPSVSDDDLALMARCCLHASGISELSAPFAYDLIGFLQARRVPITQESDLGNTLISLHDLLLINHSAKNIRYALRIRRLFSTFSPIPIDPGEPWSDRARLDLDKLDPEIQTRWIRLLNHAEAASLPKPNQNWNKTARELINEVGVEQVSSTLARWFPLVSQWRNDENIIIEDSPHFVLDHHASMLKGLCWMAVLTGSDAVCSALAELALASYRRVPGQGPRLVRVGNAAVYALGQIPGRGSIGQLAMLRIKVKYGQAQKQIEKALDAAAEREGLPRDEIEEIAVPSYGLGSVGLAREAIGDFTAEIRVGAGGKGVTHADLSFVNAPGKRLKSVPAAIKRDHAEELKDLKASLKDLKKMLPAQRDRLDGLFLGDRSWSYSAWRERYLDHPLVGVLARRMIWEFDDGKNQTSAAWLADGFEPGGETPAHGDGRLVTSNGAAFEPDADSTVVRLWHPIDASAQAGSDAVRGDVEDWRRFYEDRGVRQPFKQAHREIYLLTDAEVTTEVYSNRFAAHVLRQHQCHALCQQRGWKSMLRIAADTEVFPTHKVLPAYGLRAEFWAEAIGEDEILPSGAYMYIATDQVRFYRVQERMMAQHAMGGGVYGQGVEVEPERMDTIPPIVFSEIMRDADLFVGVSSVGNNPEWQDGGPEGRFLDAWQNYSFGDLSGTAETRRDLLGRLIPRLKIADACTITDRFLVVLGKKRTYKIHLGSGNIMMEPGDQYLCIVPDSRMEAGPKGTIHLPFEGDRTLAIILSKAFMLAEDDKITDRTILSQINR